ncbi:hypothetical protein [Streptomyces violascens]|uniref:hypothetical protein n=1 Tax=Streptomyces violascens TaxID=67381 RepID=UPI00368FC27F
MWMSTAGGWPSGTGGSLRGGRERDDVGVGGVGGPDGAAEDGSEAAGEGGGEALGFGKRAGGAGLRPPERAVGERDLGAEETVGLVWVVDQVRGLDGEQGDAVGGAELEDRAVSECVDGEVGAARVQAREEGGRVGHGGGEGDDVLGHGCSVPSKALDEGAAVWMG